MTRARAHPTASQTARRANQLRAPQNPVHPSTQKDFCFSETKTRVRFKLSRTRKRGASRSSRTLGAGCGGRGVPKDERHIRGTVKSRGPGAPMPASSLRTDASHHAGDGGKKARSPRRARRKPLKPLRRGCRTASASPVCSCAFLVSARAHETAGAARTRHSLRPPFSEGHELSKARAKFVARTRICVTLSSSAKADDPVFQRQ